MEYRNLKLGEIKRDGDELIGAHWLPDGVWRAVGSELGRKVTRGDLAWGSYRRPLKSKVAASSTSSNNARSAICGHGKRTHCSSQVVQYKCNRKGKCQHKQHP